MYTKVDQLVVYLQMDGTLRYLHGSTFTAMVPRILALVFFFLKFFFNYHGVDLTKDQLGEGNIHLKEKYKQLKTIFNLQ